jgi:hypothetical protein
MLSTSFLHGQVSGPRTGAATQTLALSHAEYLDRVQAIWTAQMIAQRTGGRFEHQPASTLPMTPMSQLPGYAPVDDDYYYEMVAVRALREIWDWADGSATWATVAREQRRFLGLKRAGLAAAQRWN